MSLLAELLTVEEIAAYMRLPHSTVYKLAQEGKLPGFKVGRHWRFRREAVLQWIQEQERTILSQTGEHG